MRYAVICPTLGTIAVFALQGDAEEWKQFYETAHPEMTGMVIEKQEWLRRYND